MSRIESATDFANIFYHTGNRADLCTLTLLAWVSASDGVIAPEEEAFLGRTASVAKGTPVNVDPILDLARKANIDDLELACRFVMTHFSKRQKGLLMQLAISLAARDGHITVGENYALQFLADLMDIRPRAFAKLFQDITHRPYPEPGDPSDPVWWRAREAGREAEPARNLGPDEPTTGSNPPPADAPPSKEMTRARALQTLGLTDNPPPGAVQSAFRRLAKARHPDRFAKLGPTAIAAATESFQQLEQAYSLLKAGT